MATLVTSTARAIRKKSLNHSRCKCWARSHYIQHPSSSCLQTKLNKFIEMISRWTGFRRKTETDILDRNFTSKKELKLSRKRKRLRNGARWLPAILLLRSIVYNEFDFLLNSCINQTTVWPLGKRKIFYVVWSSYTWQW